MGTAELGLQLDQRQLLRPSAAQLDDRQPLMMAADGAVRDDDVPEPEIGQTQAVDWNCVPVMFHKRTIIARPSALKRPLPYSARLA